MAAALPASESAAAEFGLRARLRAALPHLPRSMVKIAELLIEDPELPVRLSISELAQRAGVSPATVTRLCRQVGYTGYVALRVSAAADLGRSSGQADWGSDFSRVVDQRTGATDARDLLRALVATSVQALQNASDLVDLDAAQRAASAIAGCSHIDLYASGGSASSARALQERLYHLGINAHAHSDVHLGLMSASLLDAGAVAIAISSSGRTSEPLEMLALARTRGALTVALTSDPLSPLAEAADLRIQTAPSDPTIYPGQLGAKHVQLFTCDLLYLLVAQQLRERSDANIALTTAAISGHRATPARGARESDQTVTPGR
ncbi:MAG: MurR/RpiR family transcriptional regulator [Propionicimonas sp.]|nr:MurR/RpiR family transcriptional regulator [Propionicimonas sp.]